MSKEKKGNKESKKPKADSDETKETKERSQAVRWDGYRTVWQFKIDFARVIQFYSFLMNYDRLFVSNL